MAVASSDLAEGAGSCISGSGTGDSVAVDVVTPLEEPGFKIMVATRPIDFRRGHDGLAAYAQMALDFAPTQGLVLVFRARRSDRLKILYWDSNGIVMSYSARCSGSTE
jgi:transposase